jgi:hypothetical protein
MNKLQLLKRPLLRGYNLRTFSVSYQLAQRKKEPITPKPTDNLYRYLYKPQVKKTAEEEKSAFTADTDEQTGRMYPVGGSAPGYFESIDQKQFASQAEPDMGDNFETFRPLHHPKVSNE